MTLRLRWLATDSEGYRWELYQLRGRRRRLMVGRDLMSRSGAVSTGYFLPNEICRWKEVTTDSLRSGAHVLVALCKKDLAS